MKQHGKLFLIMQLAIFSFKKILFKNRN